MKSSLKRRLQEQDRPETKKKGEDAKEEEMTGPVYIK